ncbi:hypothetical protein QA640_10660 [Bradyrhizobium sp. CB82]|uniref:hypothetical protein n=1 Tax=Bradyrhizobium sp. CB82 TaxID=3039159 RepID=UPI0024B2665B|nr:hypothetical protein [Bradyrhizobium sp. CB82]WFU42868.1 hypothetical protein QA640_10660 [Bradyrhizobium sp. CB82]
MKPNILRFAAFDTGYYCENTLLSPQLTVGETDARAPAIERPFLGQGASAGLAAQTEMLNRTSFSEVPAARMPPFGDSGLIQIVKIGKTTRSMGRSPWKQPA